MGVSEVRRDDRRTSHRDVRIASLFTISILTLSLMATAWNASAQCTGCAQYGPSQMWTSNITSAVTDASGLAVSAKNPGIFWTHNDSGGDPFLYAVNTNGLPLAMYDISADSLVDFEDMAIGPGPSANTPYLYLGDIGVGGLGTLTRQSVRIFRAAEPQVPSSLALGIQSLAPVERFTLTYPDGSYDADTMIVDPITGDIFIGAKQTGATRIYRASLAGAQDGANVRLELVATTTLGTSGGTISADGSRIILRNERKARLWFRCPGESVGTALARDSETIPLVPTAFETNGEAIAFLPDGSGYLTLGDSVVGPPLFFFPLNCVSNIPPSTNGIPDPPPAPPPVTRIVAQPQGATVEPGSYVKLTVVATGQNLRYQWRRGNDPIPGASTDTLEFSDIQPTQSGNYSVLVIGDQGRVTSDPATVVVRSFALEPVILIPPQTTYVVRGGAAELSVSASGEEPLTYTWTLQGRLLPANGSVLSLRNVRSSGIYHVTVSNERGAAEAEADVQVFAPPSVRVTPSQRVARAGSTVVLRAVTRGAAPLEYWWKFNGVDIPGEHGSELILSGVDSSSAGVYSATIRTDVGNASGSAKLKVR
jgi:hypothetical protein